MMKLYKLNKAVLKFRNNTSQFLNGITSNEIDKPNNAFLNIHGKIVATFDQIKISEDEHQILVEQNYVDKVLEHINRYVKLGGVQVERLNDFVYFDLLADTEVQDGDRTIPQKMGQLLVTTHEREVNVSDEEFTLFRLQNNIPLHGTDYHDEMLLNVSTKDFVSFTKGCFLGQEPISKVYNRSKATWKLIVKAEDDCIDEEKTKMTSKIKDLESNKIIGFVFAKNE